MGRMNAGGIITLVIGLFIAVTVLVNTFPTLISTMYNGTTTMTGLGLPPYYGTIWGIGALALLGVGIMIIVRRLK